MVNKSKIALTVLTLMPIIILSIGQTAHAQRSLIGNYADGYEAGKVAADGASNDASCPAGHSTSYCVGYHVGFDLKRGAHGLGQLLQGFK